MRPGSDHRGVQPAAGPRAGDRRAAAHRILLATLLLASSFLAGSLAATAAEEPSSWLGRPLSQAIETLRQQGLRVIYSSDLVKPEMQVVSEPTASALHSRLEQLLAPHGLTAQVGPSGHLLVVRRPGSSMGMILVTPRPGEVTVGEVEVEAVVVGVEPVERLDLFVNGRLTAQLFEPPWRATVQLMGSAPEWHLEAVARGFWGGRESVAVNTRNLVVRDDLLVALRRLHVTVVDEPRRRRELRRELRSEHLEVFEDGIPVQIASFERQQTPLAAAVVLDTSESMAGEPLSGALRGARAFLRKLDPGDQAMLLTFADGVRAITPLGGDIRQLEQVLEAQEARGGTALHDYLYAALRLLDGAHGRRAVLLLSDGADVLSALSMTELGWKIDRSDAVIYWLRLGGAAPSRQSFSSAWRDADANRREREALERRVRASGGRLVDLAGTAGLERVLEGILEELREHDYVLDYYPLPAAEGGSWRSVEVKTNLRGVRLRYLRGYAKDSPPGAF